MAVQLELPGTVGEAILKSFLEADVRPVSFTKQMDLGNVRTTSFKVHAISNMNTKGRVKFLSFSVKNLLVEKLGSWEMPFHEVRTSLPGSVWHAF
jgi:hypothetical protein